MRNGCIKASIGGEELVKFSSVKVENSKSNQADDDSLAKGDNPYFINYI